ncbi:MAG: hypothetical protein JWP81_119 [Ferruginibacter sp.]|nr:hypothetical protein [Ferruginibacter sp.]
MEKQGLLFIPDISGFTRFVNEMEIEHSRLIIQELLEILVNANHLGLEISEIEGDAILFYKFGTAPELKELYQQVEKMFCEFHSSLKAYEYHRFCQCKACTSAINLSLKVVTHYGEFTSYQVKDFKKLIGKDIIVAHQLLKNDIDQHEYWLVTKSLVQHIPISKLTPWMQWDSSTKQIENGAIPFHYTQLSQLKNEITIAPLPQPELSRKVKVISVSKVYDIDIIPLFHATGDFHYRSRWREGVKAIEAVNHFLPRVGMRCRCVLENGQEVLYSSSYSYQPERIEFSETEESTNNATYYLLEKTGDDTTKLTIDFYIPKGLLTQTLFKLRKQNKVETIFKKSLLNLDGLVKELKPVNSVKEDT